MTLITFHNAKNKAKSALFVIIIGIILVGLGYSIINQYSNIFNHPHQITDTEKQAPYDEYNVRR